VILNKVKLGTVATVLNGYAFKSDEYVESGIRIIRITNVQKGQIQDDDPKFIDIRRCSEFTRFMLADGDILISLTGNVGRVGVIEKSMLPAALNQRVGALKIESETVEPEYLFHVLNSKEFEQDAIKNSKGVAQLNLSSRWIEKYEVPLPPLPEQKRIAKILDAADTLRAKRRESLAQLDALIQSTFLDMFGDPVTNPRGWEDYVLSDACIKITDGTHHSPPTCQGGIPYITAKHLKKDGLKFFNDPWYVSSEHHAEIYSRCDPVKGDVLYIKDGATTGIAAVNRYTFEFSMLSSLALLKPRPDMLISEYLCAYLNNDKNKSHLIGNMGGAAIKRLTLAKIKKFRIPVPPIPLQHRFASIVESIERQKIRLRSHLVELDTLFASLQHRAFNGGL
jgi:type I restriction enzyme, S subunit